MVAETFCDTRQPLRDWRHIHRLDKDWRYFDNKFQFNCDNQLHLIGYFARVFWCCGMGWTSLRSKLYTETSSFLSRVKGGIQITLSWTSILGAFCLCMMLKNCVRKKHANYCPATQFLVRFKLRCLLCLIV